VSSASAPGRPSEFAPEEFEDAAELPGFEPHEISVASVTFGAPAAHALKFKQGGLRSLAPKLLASKVPTSLGAIVGYLQLKFECVPARLPSTWRRSIGGSGGASRMCRRVRRGKPPTFEFIGSRHAGAWVSLLSTHSFANSMIEDFAGGWDNLDVDLALDEGPPAVTHRDRGPAAKYPSKWRGSNNLKVE